MKRLLMRTEIVTDPPVWKALEDGTRVLENRNGKTLWVCDVDYVNRSTFGSSDG
jgi:hypothetical protein